MITLTISTLAIGSFAIWSILKLAAGKKITDKEKTDAKLALIYVGICFLIIYLIFS